MTQYSALNVADWFLGHIDREAGDSICHLKLQKLVYYAQAYHLARFSAPLFDEDMEAWTHGPVAPSVFRRFQKYGFESIPAPTEAPAIDSATEAFLQSILDVYGEFSGRALENMTHKEAPWIKTRGGLPVEARSNAVIPKDEMRAFYGEILKG